MTCSILASHTIVGNGLRSWVDQTCLGGQTDLPERQGRRNVRRCEARFGAYPDSTRGRQTTRTWGGRVLERRKVHRLSHREEGLQLLGGAGEEVRRPHGPFDGKGVLEAPSRLGPTTEQAAEGTQVVVNRAPPPQERATADPGGHAGGQHVVQRRRVLHGPGGRAGMGVEGDARPAIRRRDGSG